MCNVLVKIKSEEDINFTIYNIILSKKLHEFTVEEIANDLQPYVNWEYPKVESKIKKLIQIWLKSGVIEERINTFVEAS